MDFKGRVSSFVRGSDFVRNESVKCMPIAGIEKWLIQILNPKYELDINYKMVHKLGKKLPAKKMMNELPLPTRTKSLST